MSRTPMKLILTQEVSGLGAPGDVVDVKAVAGQLEGLQVRMRRRAGGSGRLFGSVGPADIAAAVREAGGPELDRRRIEVRDPIKTVGSHQVRVRLHPEVSAAVDIEITAS